MGLLMAALKLTASPLTEPSKISVELPSSPVNFPVTVLPELLSANVDLRSPIGVCIESFQVLSADMPFSCAWCFDRQSLRERCRRSNGFCRPDSAPIFL